MSALIGLGMVGIVLMILLVIIPLLAGIFWVWMIVDCAQRTFKDKNDKIVWMLVILLINVAGALIYYFIIKRKR